MNLAIDLRKSNLLLESLYSALVKLSAVNKLFSNSVENSQAKQKAQLVSDQSDYYARAPKRVAKPASIQRELTASGNSW